MMEPSSYTSYGQDTAMEVEAQPPPPPPSQAQDGSGSGASGENEQQRQQGAGAGVGGAGDGAHEEEEEEEEEGGVHRHSRNCVVQVGSTEYEACSSKREIGCLAVWSVTSNKPGNGVEYLRDNNIETYWQSDGTQPHLVNIQFQRKVRVMEVVMYVDYRNDESYTPQKVSFHVGSSYYDLQEIKTVELEEPQGWVVIPLAVGGNEHEGTTKEQRQGGGGSSQGFVRTHCLQIAILSNHQNGRDTHLRQIKVFGPRIDVTRSADQPFSFTHSEFTRFAGVR